MPDIALAPKNDEALARVAPAPIAPFNPQDLWPRSFDEVMRLASFLAKSGLVPKHLQGNEANTFYTIMAGLELSISPIVACREIYLVDGKPSCSSLLKVALVRERRDLCLEWQEIKSTDKVCIYKTRRLGDKQSTVREWTIEMAHAAQLTNKDNWKKYPAAMLRRRCQGQLADDVYPDVVRGLGSYDDEAPLTEIEMGTLQRVPTKVEEDTEPQEEEKKADADDDIYLPLEVAIVESTTDEALAAAIEKVTSEDRLSDEQKNSLRELVKDQRKKLRKSNGA